MANVFVLYRSPLNFALSLLVGLLVGATYGLLRVPSPAPPLVALLGLLGIVVGERCVSYWLG